MRLPRSVYLVMGFAFAACSQDPEGIEGARPQAQPTPPLAGAGVQSSTDTATDSQAVAADPMVADPMVADPMVADPMVADPMVADPMVADPMVADPTVADPMVADPGSEGACTPPPPGSFSTMIQTRTGPGGNYTVVRPTTLGEGGFLHPPVAWGNGLGTTPDLYTELLESLASHGFVVIANPGTGSNPQVVRQGLEWLIDQNGSGDYAGKLAVDCAGTIGYSMGGGAAVGSGSHPAVKAIVSIHGLQDAADKASGPILLTTSEGDAFVTKSGFVEPCYRRSTVQPTILASHRGGDHLDPIGTGGESIDPAIAWLRYWIYGDQSQREWFFGDDCTLCSWPDFRRKNHPEWK